MSRHYKQDNPPRRHLSRRAVLRGVGGAAVALPLLEIMLDSQPARAQTAPLRYLVMFAGQSLGADGDPAHNMLVPDATGSGYDLKTATMPLMDLDVQDEVTIVSGLDIPVANGGSPPPGGRPDDFHINNMGPLLTGVRSTDHDKAGPTSDQIVADAIGTETVFRSLIYQVQASWYLSVSAPYGRDILSVRDDGSDLIEVPGLVSPKSAYDALFYNFAPPDDAEAAAAQDFAWRQRTSVIDLVKKRADALMQKLGGADKIRIQRHLDEIRDLEKQISTLPPAPGGQCQQFLDPGADPTLGGNQPDGGFDQNVGYSGEEERARTFMDLIHMAFTCDLTRVGAVLMTMAQSHLNMFQLTGHATDLHEIGHNGPTSDGTISVAEANGWHFKHFAYLVDRLRNTPEGNGTMLDNCGLLLLFEGGHGFDASTGNQNSSHSTQNMALAIAGGAGGLVRGQHIAATGMHPGNAILTVMNAVGVETNTFGEVSGTIPALIG